MGNSYSSLTVFEPTVPLATTLVPDRIVPRVFQDSKPHSPVVFSDGYEEYGPPWNHTRHRVDGHGSIVAVTNPVFRGQQSVKFTVPNDGISWRSEIAKNSLGYGSFSFAFTNYLPTDWLETSLNTIVAQWHGYPLADGNSTKPTISLCVQHTRWLLRVNHLENPSDSKPKGQIYELGHIVKGKWNQWDFRIDWSRPELNGTITVALNNKTVAEHYGYNNYHQKQAPYFKQGIYRPNWNPEKGLQYSTGGPSVVVYVDDVVVTKLH